MDKEEKLDFEKAKDMTIGQAARKSEELEAGVRSNDSVLDKYIKQHREEIEAGKYVASETSSEVSLSATKGLDELIKDVRLEETAASTVETPRLATGEEASPTFTVSQTSESSSETDDRVDVEETKIIPMDDIPVSLTSWEEVTEEDEVLPFYKSKRVIYTSAVVLFLLLIAGGTYAALNNRGNSQTTASSSQTSTSTSSAASSSASSEASALENFETLYGTFFTDNNQTNLKNSSFGGLDNLKQALDKLEGTSDYDSAKAKYDSLVKQVSAIQAVNSQFETPAIVDGVLDINAQVKADATFTEETTDNSSLDTLLSSAINQGRSQQASTAQVATSAASVTESATTNQASSAPAIQAGSGYGLSSQGVSLQRDLSRVPYNQSAIDDVNNSAWQFNAGVLEKILQTSRERGYITGDNYILEKVNIINGNGYYNLFKPDGTYLFSLNCKTGYFVGNASGHSDALDY